MPKPKYDDKIIGLLQPDIHVGVTDLAEWVETNRETIWYALRRLERQGKVRVKNRNRNRKPLKITIPRLRDDSRIPCYTMLQHLGEKPNV